MFQQYCRRMPWLIMFILPIAFLCLKTSSADNNPVKLRVERTQKSSPPGFGSVIFSGPKTSKRRTVRFLWDNTWELAEETRPGQFAKILARGKLINDGTGVIAEGFPGHGLPNVLSIQKIGPVNVWLQDEPVTKVWP